MTTEMTSLMTHLRRGEKGKGCLGHLVKLGGEESQRGANQVDERGMVVCACWVHSVQTTSRPNLGGLDGTLE